MKKRPRPPRWTDYRPEYAREIYWAIRDYRIEKPTHPAIAELFRVHPNTILNWMKRHKPFARAIERGLGDRFDVWLATRRCRHVKYDPCTLNWEAKTERGVFSRAVVIERSFDQESFERETRHLHMRKNRWREDHIETVGHIIASEGPLSNRRLCEHFAVAESTLRLWRRRYPAFEKAICDGVRAQRSP